MNQKREFQEFQEFREGGKIKFQIKDAPSELIDMLKEWSDSVPTLYFLDICVVSYIKSFLEKEKIDERKSRCIERLKELDRSQHRFSYLLALMEKVSDSRGGLTKNGLEEQILKDVDALRDFFKKAKICESNDFLIDFLEFKGRPIEIGREKYLKFLNILNYELELWRPVASDKRIIKARDILDKADCLEIGRHHPVVILSLACLYGNGAARKVIKFKGGAGKFDAENSLADIMNISRFAQHKLQLEAEGREGCGKFLRVDFLTEDKGFLGIVKCFEPKFVRHKDKNEIRETMISFDLKPEFLFPEMSSDDYEPFRNLLR